MAAHFRAANCTGGRIMKLVSATAFVLFAAAGSANAETFTFKSTITTVNSLSVTTAAKTVVGAGFNEGETQVAYALGQKATQKYTCAGWSAPMGSQFTDEGICTYSEGANDKASILFSCVSDAKTGTGDCWGGLRGTAGRFMGKTGTVSWHQTNNPDGKTGAATGIGMWNE
jgi:hypothetical protein